MAFACVAVPARVALYCADVLIGIIVLGAASIAVAVGVILCAAGVIRRNPWVGLRIPSLFASDAAWKAGHRAAVLPVLCSTVVNVVLAILALTMMAASPGTVLIWVALVVLLAGTIIGAVLGSRAARRITAL